MERRTVKPQRPSKVYKIMSNLLMPNLPITNFVDNYFIGESTLTHINYDLRMTHFFALFNSLAKIIQYSAYGVKQSVKVQV